MKKKIFIIPHTHWDREWYFTNVTSNILLQRLAKDLIDYKVDKFTLDGQSSLFYDMLKNSPDLKEKLEEKVKEKKLIVGPLFSQQDNFNVLAATTQLNIDFSTKICKKENKQKTMYMPDSFGFNEQLPQIFKLNGFNNFVFWRGIKPEDKKYSNLFYWKGIDNTKIQTSCMSNGYYTLGQYYPYNKEEDKRIEFKKQLIQQSKELNKKNNQKAYFLPLGGDQAPYEYEIKRILKEINLEQSEYEFSLGSYDDYFDFINNKPLKEIDYALNYSGTSKIHRTIHSNRVDIKILFRECERLLHLGIRPLEIMFKSMNGKLISEKIIELNAIVPLLKSAAHDSLGCCNSDITNSLVKNRLIKIKNFLESYIDLIIRDINKVFGKKNHILVYNQMPFKKDVFKEIIISNSSKENLTNSDGSIVEIEKEDISWKEHDDIWNHKVQIFEKDIPAFSWKVIDLYKEKEKEKIKFNNFIEIENNGFKLFNNKITFLAETDDGDEFDFSEHNNPIYSEIISNKIIEKKIYQKQQIIKTETIIKYKNIKQKININWTNIEDKIYSKIFIKNQLKNIRFSLVLEKGDVLLSRHLAFINQKTDNIKNWKEKKYKDKPINSHSNDGLVSINNLSILTRGNNEVVISKNNNKIVLFRSVNFLGKPNLNYRPGVASGLLQKVHTPDALMKEEQEYNLCFTNNKNIISKLNDWNSYDIASFVNQTNPIIQKYDRFVINEIDSLSKPSLNKIKFNKNDFLLSYIKNNKNQIEIFYSNPLNKKIENCKPYEIKKEQI